MDARKCIVTFVVTLALAAFVFVMGPSAPTALADEPAAARRACPANWSITGNCGTVPGTNFLGTTDSQALVIKTNNAERVRIMPNGRVGIGTNAPATTLQVVGVTSLGPNGSIYGYQVAGGSPGPYPTLGFNTYNANYIAGLVGFGGLFQFQNGDGKLIYYTGSNVAAGSPHVNYPRFTITNNGSVGIGTTTPSSTLEIASQNGLAITGYQPYLTLRDANAGNARSIIQGVNGDMALFSSAFIGGNAPVVIKNSTGYVGIGTIGPSAQLSVVRSGAPEPAVAGIPTGLKVGTQGGTIPLALKQNAAESGTPTLAYFETANGAIGALGATSGAFVVGATAGKALAFNVNGSSRAMTIASSGAVGIGTNIISARLHVHDTGTTSATYGLRVDNGNGDAILAARNDGKVWIGYLGSPTAGHVCYDGAFQGWLSRCSSAAEYVPSIDSGQGFPQSADIVSIAPNVQNPYGDEHSPFTVQKSTTACDPNLLGFILNPKLGADGTKLNDHYLPLAIFGYFPAKVTMLNGAIKRGDPLTSSDKPGYAMKATGACKIIGYALEDTSVEGTIQVFSHLSENTAPEVASLHKQVETLTQENVALQARVDAQTQQNLALKNELTTIETRLAALELAAPPQAKTGEQVSMPK